MLTRSSGLQGSGRVDWHLVAADTCPSDNFWQLAKWDEKRECCSCQPCGDLFLEGIRTIPVGDSGSSRGICASVDRELARDSLNH